MEWVPPVSEEVVKEAFPLESIPVPITAVPDLNVTVPPGVLTPEVTVAVKVTGCPWVDGFFEETTFVELGAV